MTTTLFAPAAYARYQTSGASYTADEKGVIAGAAAGDVIDLIRSGCTMLPAYDNFSATTDPSGSDDHTQDYSLGSRWLNTTASRAWTCLSAATGAAIWVLDGVAPGVGVMPSNMLTYFGSGTGTILSDGNLHRQIGNPLAGNNADTEDDVLASYALPASSFDVAGRGLCITAQGSTGATTNDKRIKLWFNAAISAGVVTGASVIADTGAWGQRDDAEQQRRLATDGQRPQIRRCRFEHTVRTGYRDPRRHPWRGRFAGLFDGGRVGRYCHCLDGLVLHDRRSQRRGCHLV